MNSRDGGVASRAGAKSVRLVLLGPPASGKGTQARLMATHWGVPVTSVGEVLRQQIAAGTPLGIEAAAFIDAGKLVPDRIALGCAEGWLEGHADSFVFDGFPRTVGQARALEEILGLRHMPLTAAIWLEVPVHIIEERVSRRVICRGCGQTFGIGWQVEHRNAPCPVCGAALTTRGDDDPRTLARRLAEYREYTEPLLAFYGDRGLLRRIEASRPADTVFADVEAALGIAPSTTMPEVLS